MPYRLSVILTKAPSTDKLQFYINFSDTVWIAAASMGAVGASEGGGRNGGWSGRCEGGGAVVVGREADEGPKEKKVSKKDAFFFLLCCPFIIHFYF